MPVEKTAKELKAEATAKLKKIPPGTLVMFAGRKLVVVGGYVSEAVANHFKNLDPLKPHEIRLTNGSTTWTTTPECVTVVGHLND